MQTYLYQPAPQCFTYRPPAAKRHQGDADGLRWR